MNGLDSIYWRLLAVCAAAGPAALLIVYFYAGAAWRHLRELIVVAFGLGFSVAIPIAGIASLYAPEIATIESVRLHAAAVAFLEAAIPEELGKLLVVTCILLRHEDLRRPVDAIILTVLVGLGFATIENLYYVFSSENWTETAMLRAITAVPMHATVGIIMGYLGARFILADRNRLPLLAAMFIFPTILHGMYDYPVFAIQNLLTQHDHLDDSVYLEFQGIFIASITASALAAMTIFRAVANTPAMTEPAPWFRAAVSPANTRSDATR